jgi:hypothetical protein
VKFHGDLVDPLQLGIATVLAKTPDPPAFAIGGKRLEIGLRDPMAALCYLASHTKLRPGPFASV